MRSLEICSVLLLMTIVAAPALAVPPTAGDIFFAELEDGRQVFRIDPMTSNVEVVSCWDNGLGPCPTPRGSGVSNWEISGNHDMKVGPDGRLYLIGIVRLPSTSWEVFRIDPETGDREQVTNLGRSEPEPGFLNQSDPWAVWPAANFFPASVASLGTWGLAMLVVGIFIGVQLRIRKADEA